jgi:hypothetical protein
VLPALTFGAGEDNPTGVASYYNGYVTTGCAYDPYTGNTKRVVNDLTMPLRLLTDSGGPER